MLTELDKAILSRTGNVSQDRMAALAHALREMARTASRAAEQLDKDSQGAAALRGKRKAYFEAALLVEQVANGCGLHPRPGWRAGIA